MIDARSRISTLILFVTAILLFAVFSKSAYADTPEIQKTQAETSQSDPTSETESLQDSTEQTTSPPVSTPDVAEPPQDSEEHADTPSNKVSEPEKPEARAEAEKEEEEPATLFYGYWKQGLYIKTPKKHFELKIGGKIYVDAGYLNSGSEIQEAFPDFDGPAYDFRKLSIAFSGSVWQKIDFKLEIDFANVQDIQDEWIRFSTIPVLKYMTFGHVKEPFSLENLSSSNYITFMEHGLPNEPFVPGRNIGVLINNLAKENHRITWAGGLFLNTGSFSTVGDSRDQIDQANGYDVSARITGLPWYRNDGANLLHLGLSYNYRNRDAAHSDSIVQFRARPESRLTDDRLIDTGDLSVEYVNIIDPEIAFVSGPFSLQGEFFYSWADAADELLRFWGTYVYGSVFLTGEHRIYNTSRGVFSEVTPHENLAIFRRFSNADPDQDFRPRYGLGAVELGARFSYVDLNDKTIQGGEEANVTVGLNWYIKSNARLMVNYIHGLVTDRADPPIEDDTSNIIQTRFQIYF